MSDDRSRTSLEVLDWRRRVHELYRTVRAEADPATAHALWRAGRDELYGTHPATALVPEDRARFLGLPVQPYDPAWRFEVRVDPAEPARLEIETGTDGVVRFERIGVAHVPHVGSLDVWWLASYGGGIFVPVKDALHGRAGGTYGGGRYLLDTVKGADLGTTTGTPGTPSERSRLVLDFNFAYNPSCAYDPEWACPLAQPGNTVPVPIPVGELDWHSAGRPPAE